jgi:hypothetical protein
MWWGKGVQGRNAEMKWRKEECKEGAIESKQRHREGSRERRECRRKDAEPIIYVSVSPSVCQDLGRQDLCLLHFSVPTLSPNYDTEQMLSVYLLNKPENRKTSQPITNLQKVYCYLYFIHKKI